MGRFCAAVRTHISLHRAAAESCNSFVRRQAVYFLAPAADSNWRRQPRGVGNDPQPSSFRMARVRDLYLSLLSRMPPEAVSENIAPQVYPDPDAFGRQAASRGTQKRPW